MVALYLVFFFFYLVFKVTSILFSIVPVANNVGRFPFLHPFQFLLFVDVLMAAILTDMR